MNDMDTYINGSFQVTVDVFSKLGIDCPPNGCKGESDQHFMFDNEPFFREKETGESTDEAIWTSDSSLVVEGSEPVVRDDEPSNSFWIGWRLFSGKVDGIPLWIFIIVDGWHIWAEIYS